MSDVVSRSEQESVAEVTRVQPVAPAKAVRPRVWPGLVILAGMWAAIGAMWFDPSLFMLGMFGPMVASGLAAAWWLFFSRVPWVDRLVGLAAFVLGCGGFLLLAHSSMGAFALILFVLRAVLTACVGWLVVTPFLSWPVRRIGLAAALVLTLGWFDMVRIADIDGQFRTTFNWRWTPTKEETYLEQAQGKQASATPVSEAVTLAPGDWVAFRGSERDGRVPGVRIATDWDNHPPAKLWRHRVGPGWTSFCVIGNRVFTQEQRGEKEYVVCYAADTGAELWSHADAARFEEVVAGPGPRATPTFHEGRLYTMGAKGTVDCLDPATGSAFWSRDVEKDAGVAKDPQWGYSSSPLVTHGLVIVFAGAGKGKCLQAYRAADGEPAWTAGDGTLSYCSPQLSKLHGVEQVLITTDQGVASVDLKGKTLWQHDWESGGMPRCVQPTVIGDSDVLVGSGLGKGLRRVHVEHAGGGWTATEKWTSRAISPYFNDVVIYKDSLYGLDGGMLTCVRLEDGKKRWRGRGPGEGYGAGQILLLRDQELLLVLGEQGRASLVKANPDKHEEIGSFQALDSKTWNHPVIAHDKLFVRNDAEAACYQLQAKE